MSSNAANSAAKRRRAGAPATNNLFQKQNRSILQTQQFQQPYRPSNDTNDTNNAVNLKKIPIDTNVIKQRQLQQQNPNLSRQQQIQKLQQMQKLQQQQQQQQQ